MALVECMKQEDYDALVTLLQRAQTESKIATVKEDINSALNLIYDIDIED